jgi:uncharacterized phage-associated protein
MGIANLKYKNTILYLCSKLGGTIRGKKKLAKLLYYVDFDRYEFNESAKTVTGDTYEAWKMGPVPKHYMDIVTKLEQEGTLKAETIEGTSNYYPTEVYSTSTQPDISVFDEDDKIILDRVINRYGQLSGKQLEELTHAEAPFIATEQSQEIIFDLAFYRGTDFSDAMAGA